VDVESNKVIIVSHSQGNFFANQAYSNAVISEASRASIGIVGVANPDSFVAGGGPHVTLFEDAVINAYRLFRLSRGLPGPQTPNATNFLNLNDPTQHFFIASYLPDGSDSETKILQAIKNVGNSRQQPPPCEEEKFVVQPGPSDGTDVWITNVLSWDSDFGVDDNTLRVGGWNDTYHSLIQFDLTGLPQVAGSASIQLYHDLAWLQADNRIAPEMQLFRVDGPWDESLGWYTPQPEATYLANLPAAGDGWYEIDITNLYNQWQAGTVANFGIELQPVTNVQNSTRFLSSDYLEDPSLRPKLVVRR
jgi:hypothetical protein